MDYPQRARLKIMGHARVLDSRDEPQLGKQVVANPSLQTKTERIFVVDVVSFDWNCPQHITPRYTIDQIEAEIVTPLRERIAKLEAQLNLRQTIATDSRRHSRRDAPPRRP